MKVIVASSTGFRLHRRLVALTAALVLCGCAREDEELQRQLVETRAALAAKSKALEEAESQRNSPPPSAPAPAPAPASMESTAELAKARSRISELESQLAATKQRAPAAAAPAKLNLDELKDKLEGDLTNKARTLRELLLKQAGVSHIDEIGIRGIEYPPEIIAPFRSAITFSLSANDGRQLRLIFPVTADLEGSWSLPGPDKVQQAYKQVRDAPPDSANVASAPAEAPSPATATSPPRPAPPPPSSPSGFRQVDPNTFQFDWGDAAKTGAKSRSGQPATSTATTTASAPGVSAPQQPKTVAPTTPAAPAQPEVSVPKPVMPVQRDIIIKF